MNKVKFTNFFTALLSIFISMLTIQANSLKVVNKTAYPISVKNIPYIESTKDPIMEVLKQYSGNPAKAKEANALIDKILPSFPGNPVIKDKDGFYDWGNKIAVYYFPLISQGIKDFTFSIKRGTVEKEFQTTLVGFI